MKICRDTVMSMNGRVGKLKNNKKGRKKKVDSKHLRKVTRKRVAGS